MSLGLVSRAEKAVLKVQETLQDCLFVNIRKYKFTLDLC